MNSSAAITAEASAWMSSAQGSAASLSHAMWRGIDLIDVRVQAFHGHLAFDDPGWLGEELRRPEAAV